MLFLNQPGKLLVTHMGIAMLLQNLQLDRSQLLFGDFVNGVGNFDLLGALHTLLAKVEVALFTTVAIHALRLEVIGDPTSAPSSLKSSIASPSIAFRLRRQ